jgi:alkylhydroperoxidase family enzyme
MGELPTGRYAALTQGLVDSVLTTRGHTPSDLRRAVLARARSLAERGRGEGGGPADGVPVPLAGYLDKVALHAYKVGDEDVAALQRAGSSDDALFEVTVAAALGAALGRLDRGLAALRGEEPD